MNFQHSDVGVKHAPGKLKNIPPLKKILICLAVVLCGIFLPLFLFNENLSGLLSIITVFFCGSLLFASSRKASVLVSTGIVLFLLVSLFNSFSTASLFLCMLTAVGAGSYLAFLSERKNVWLFFMLPVFSFSAVYLITGSLMHALLSLLPYPAIFAQTLMLKRKASKLSSVAVCSLTMIVTLAAAVALYLVSINAGISDLVEAIDILRDRLVEFLADYHIEGPDGTKIYLIQSSDRESVRFVIAALIDNLFNIIPAAVTILIMAFFYLAHSYSISLCENSTDYDLISPKMRTLDVPLSVSVVFLVAFAISLTTDASGNDMFPTVVARNIYLILSPPLFVTGLSKIMGFIKSISSKNWILIITIAVMVLLMSISVTVCIFLGAGILIVNSAKKWADRT